MDKTPFEKKIVLSKTLRERKNLQDSKGAYIEKT